MLPRPTVKWQGHRQGGVVKEVGATRTSSLLHGSLHLTCKWTPDMLQSCYPFFGWISSGLFKEVASHVAAAHPIKFNVLHVISLLIPLLSLLGCIWGACGELWVQSDGGSLPGLQESRIRVEESDMAGAMPGGNSQPAMSGGPCQGSHGCKAYWGWGEVWRVMGLNPKTVSCLTFARNCMQSSKKKKKALFGLLNQNKSWRLYKSFWQRCWRAKFGKS